MKRYWILIVLMLGLSACTFEVVPATPQVTVTPATVNVAPGGAVEVTATVNDSRPTDFNWELVGTSAGFVNLEPNRSRVVFNAPTTEGEYTLRASTVAFNSTLGEAKIRVSQVLAGTPVSAIDSPNGPSNDQALTTGTLQPGAFANFVITVPAEVASKGKAFFTEVTQVSGTGVTLTTYSPDLSVYASSADKDVFSAGALSTSSNNLLSPQVVLPYNCAGPCVIRDSQAATFYARIANPTATAISYRFFAYVKNYGDTGEDANDQQATGIVLTDTDLGAIETLGDVDFYRIQTTGTLFFIASAKMDTVAIVRSAQGTEIARLRGGQNAAVQAGQILEVKSESGTRAGASGSTASGYGLDIN
jgi:hypothetical protein